MPSNPKRPTDPILLARQIVEEAIGEKLINKPIPFPIKIREKNQAAVDLGRLGGRKGGRARADKLSAQRRKEIAQEAAKARWAKKSGV